MRSYILPFTLMSVLFFNSSLVLAKEAQNKTADAETLTAAKKLVDHLIGSTFIEQMAKQSWGAIASEVKSKNPNIDAAQLEHFRLAFLDLQKQNMDDILADTPQIYARYYTKEELTQLYEFQTSPLGKKTLEVTPKIMGEMMPVILKKVQTIAPRIQQLMRERIKEKGYKI
ncbi:MAG: DUF2059 domain-containing protein [Hyphomicrobiales bacterium]